MALFTVSAGITSLVDYPKTVLKVSLDNISQSSFSNTKSLVHLTERSSVAQMQFYYFLLLPYRQLSVQAAPFEHVLLANFLWFWLLWLLEGINQLLEACHLKIR